MAHSCGGIVGARHNAGSAPLQARWQPPSGVMRGVAGRLCSIVLPVSTLPLNIFAIRIATIRAITPGAGVVLA